jgi:paraquat-inducible protein B
VTSIRGAFDGVDKFVRSPDLDRAVVELHQTLASIHRVTGALEPQVQPTLKDLRAALVEAKGALETLNGTLVSARGLLEPNAPLVVDIGRTLAEVGDAANSVRMLADDIDRKPNSLIVGR